MSLLSAFNTSVINFLDDCILIFPNDNDFKVYKRALQMLTKYNPRKVNIIFKEYLELYRVQIETRNETFFLENNYEEVKKYNEEEIFNVINKLKEYWKNIDNNNKEKIWGWMELLKQISDKL